MRVESSNDVGYEGPYAATLDDLWLHWADPPPGLAGGALRRALFATFADALQWRWSHGGYLFRFVEAERRPESPADDDARGARALLGEALPPERGGAFGLAWLEPAAALASFLDAWLFFRQSHPYVRIDDVPPWMAPVLRAPWAAVLAELGGGTAGARAAVVEGENLRGAWGDHGVALVLAAGPRLCALHVSLWTD